MFAKNIKNKNNIIILFLLLVFLFLVGRGLELNLSPDDDDFSYLSVVASGDSWGFLKNRYFVWSGRFVLDGFLLLTIAHSWVWKALIPCCIFLLAWSIEKICRLGVNFSHQVFVMALFLIFMIPEHVAQNAMWWITGFYNYLLPLACGFFALSVFVDRDESNTWLKILSLAALVFACFSEQIAVLVICLSVALVVYARRLKKYEIIFISLAVIFFLVLYLAPGNYLRSQVELRWFPDYRYYGFFQKISFGLDRLHVDFWSRQSFLVPILMGLALCVLIKMKILQGFILKLSLVLLSSYFLFYIFSVQQNFHLGFPVLKEISSDNWLSVTKYLSYFYMLVLFSLIGNIFISMKKGWLIAFIFFMAIALTIVVGLSPSIYGSGSRILFLFNVSVVLAIVFLASHLLQAQKQPVGSSPSSPEVVEAPL